MANLTTSHPPALPGAFAPASSSPKCSLHAPYPMHSHSVGSCFFGVICIYLFALFLCPSSGWDYEARLWRAEPLPGILKVLPKALSRQWGGDPIFGISHLLHIRGVGKCLLNK